MTDIVFPKSTCWIDHDWTLSCLLLPIYLLAKLTLILAALSIDNKTVTAMCVWLIYLIDDTL